MTTHQIHVNGLGLGPPRMHGRRAIIGQEYRVDVTLWVNLAPSAATDDLAQTVDYVDVPHCQAEMGVQASSSSRCASASWPGCAKSFPWPKPWR